MGCEINAKNFTDKLIEEDNTGEIEENIEE